MRRPYLHLASVGSIALLTSSFGILMLEHNHNPYLTIMYMIALMLAPLWATVKATT